MDWNVVVFCFGSREMADKPRGVHGLEYRGVLHFQNLVLPLDDVTSEIKMPKMDRGSQFLTTRHEQGEIPRVFDFLDEVRAWVFPHFSITFV